MVVTIKKISIMLLVCFAVFFVLFLILILPRKSTVNILMYHSVVNGENVFDQFAPSVGLKTFEWQMKFLSQHGYKTVFLNEAIDRYKLEKKVPSDWVVLTFDGGYDGFYINAYPILKRYGFKAVVYVIVSAVDSEGFVTWDQLREMQNSGLVRVGSNSLNYKYPKCLTSAEAWKEKEESKRIIEKNLGTKVYTYSYPYGAYSKGIEALVKKAGYKGAVGAIYPRDEFKRKNIFNLRRIYVFKDSDAPLIFRFMLSGYYVPVRALLSRLLKAKPSINEEYYCF